MAYEEAACYGVRLTIGGKSGTVLGVDGGEGSEMTWQKSNCEMSATTPKSIVDKVNSWVHHGTHTPLTLRESKRLLKANCVVDEHGCWIWPFNAFKNGYGRLSCRMVLAIGVNTSRVHVAAYRLWNGAISGNLYVCHSCDVKRCFNPKHLWLGTNKDNQLDAASKGVFAKYWTKVRREEKRRLCSGSGNPMYGRRGKDAPAYGRVGKLHPMFGKHHSEESKDKISAGLLRAHEEGRR